MSLNLGLKAHLKALAAVAASAAAPPWCLFTTCGSHGGCGSRAGGKCSVSLFSCIMMKTHFRHLWYTCFSWNEAVVFHCAVITRTHATEIIKWREGNWCALTGTSVRCWLYEFLSWSDLNRIRFLELFFFLGLRLLSWHYKAKMEFNAL